MLNWIESGLFLPVLTDVQCQVISYFFAGIEYSSAMRTNGRPTISAFFHDKISLFAQSSGNIEDANFRLSGISRPQKGNISSKWMKSVIVRNRIDNRDDRPYLLPSANRGKSVHSASV